MLTHDGRHPSNQLLTLERWVASSGVYSVAAALGKQARPYFRFRMAARPP